MLFTNQPWLFVYCNEVRQLLRKGRYGNIKRRNTEETPVKSTVMTDSTLMLKDKYDASSYVTK